MDDTKPTVEDLKQALESTSAQETKVVDTKVDETKVETSDEPLKVELERVKGKKTPAEKARDSLYFNAKQAKELGIDVTKDEKLKEVLGLKDQPKEEDGADEEQKPLTREEVLELIQSQNRDKAIKTAEELASEITNEAERELTVFHLQNTIKSTGNPQEDLKLARALTNSVRNTKILEEQVRKPEAKNHSSASSGGSVTLEPEVVLTAEEQAFLNTGHVTKAEILLAREGKPIPR